MIRGALLSGLALGLLVGAVVSTGVAFLRAPPEHQPTPAVAVASTFAEWPAAARGAIIAMQVNARADGWRFGAQYPLSPVRVANGNTVWPLVMEIHSPFSGTTFHGSLAIEVDRETGEVVGVN